jgi:hypothetical protein
MVSKINRQRKIQSQNPYSNFATDVIPAKNFKKYIPLWQKSKLSFGETRLLNYLNSGKHPFDLMEDENLIGVKFSPESATAIVAKRRKFGNFSNLEQVVSIKGVDKKGFLELKNFLELPNVVKIKAPRNEQDVFTKYWNKIPSRDKEKIMSFYPGFQPNLVAVNYYDTASWGIMATTIAVGAVPLGIPEELVWKEFRKRIAAWLAKRGIVAGALALADGPLPIGDILAIGLAIWTAIELISLLSKFWEDAVLAISISEAAEKFWQTVPELINHIQNKLPNSPMCSNCWWYYIGEIAGKLKTALDKFGRIRSGTKKWEEANTQLTSMVAQLINYVRNIAPGKLQEVIDILTGKGLGPYIR